MFNQHPASDVFAGIVRKEKADRKAAEEAKRNGNRKSAPVLDAVDEDAAGTAADYAAQDVSLKAAAALQEWAEVSSGDLDEGESLATRLSMMMVGIADADMDGEIGDDEMGVLQGALEAAWDYLAGKGVSEDDISSLLNDWDDAAATRVQELLASHLPDGEEAAGADMDSFAFGDGSDESALDAVYKKRLVVRGGRKIRINKRISGHVRLSAKQKVAVRKMLRRSHSAGAQMRRAKSQRVRKQMGL